MNSRLVGGKYEILRKIGEGGAACIFLAVDKSNKRNVALKIPKGDQQKIYESLKNEYLFAFTHSHPSLLKPYDIIFDSQKPIIVTPFLDGVALDEFIYSLKKKSKMDSYILISKRIFAAILEAADFIHFSGYCYNDFKPSNIIAYDYDENKGMPEIALIDFNLITAISDKPKRRGTLHYLAPEVILGEPSTPTSDIYSIGVLFYQLLTGVLPFESENNSRLIEHITETGRIDLSVAPECFRDGLDFMLTRDPDKRLAGASRAAEALGIADYFDGLKKSRTEYYLASGPPPFSIDLKKRFDIFRRSDSKKLFLLNGFSYGKSAIDFLESEYRVEETDCVRIHDTDNVNKINKTLDDIISTEKTNKSKIILFIEDLESLGNENLRKLAEIINNRHNVHTAAAVGRWFKPYIKHEIFDPIKYWRRMRVTEISLKTFLKRDQLDFDLQTLCESTGGDPERIFYYLKYIGERKGLDFQKTELSEEKFCKDVTIPENEYFYRRMFDVLKAEQRELISMLSAWGNSISLLMLVEIDRKKHEIVEALTRTGYLVRHKDSVSFFSGGLREYVYGRIADPIKRDYHKFWAISTEELISDNSERLELTAHHWGLSGDAEQGYRYNETAAKEFYKNGDYFKARKFAKILLESRPKDRPGRISALIINGHIYAAIGYFKTARKMYLDILSNECDQKTKAETKKELGKLYLSSGNYKKSFYYIKKCLDCFTGAYDDKNLSECNNIIALALWRKKDHLLSLEHLIKTAKNGSVFYKNSGSEKLPDLKNDMYNIMNTALGISNNLKNHKIIIKSYIGLGQHYLKNGDFDKAVGQLKKALEISEKTGNNNDIIESLINLGSCHLISGDLFMAIECFQNARQVAESFDNIYLKTLAELALTDVSMVMGNYSLADEVLAAIENDDIYNEDKLLRLKIDLRRARLYLALGDSKASLLLTERISKSAGIMGKQKLALRADLVAAEAEAEISGIDNIEKLKVIFSKAKKHNLTDIVAEIQFSMGKYYKNHNNRYNALYYFEDIYEANGTSRRIKLEAAIHIAEISANQNRYETAIENLIEMESIAAASGFIPIALQAAKISGALHNSRGRVDLFEDCNYRANGYLEKLLSALPKGYPAEKYRKKLILSRVEHFSDVQIETETPVKKEPSAVNLS